MPSWLKVSLNMLASIAGFLFTGGLGPLAVRLAQGAISLGDSIAADANQSGEMSDTELAAWRTQRDQIMASAAWQVSTLPPATPPTPPIPPAPPAAGFARFGLLALIALVCLALFALPIVAQTNATPPMDSTAMAKVAQFSINVGAICPGIGVLISLGIAGLRRKFKFIDNSPMLSSAVLSIIVALLTELVFPHGSFGDLVTCIVTQLVSSIAAWEIGLKNMLPAPPDPKQLSASHS